MIRRNFIKRSFLERTPILNSPALKFHLAPKILARGAFCRNRPNVEKQIENESEPLISSKSNVNFFGIESEEGVITTGSKRNFTQQNILKDKLKERFHRASFGVIRYDSDNKLKFHGQYGNTYDSFPHNNDEYSVITGNHTKVLSSSNQICNDFNVKRLDCSESSKIYEDDTTCNTDVLNKKSSDPNNSIKDDQNTSNIDEYYFNNSYNQISNDFEVNRLDSSIISSKICEDVTTYSTDVLKNDMSDQSDILKNDQNTSFVDEYYFNNSYKEKEQSVKNNSDQSPISEELNFIDQNYFGDLTDSENKKCQVQNVFQNTPFVKEADTGYTDTFSLEELKSDNIEGKKQRSLQNHFQSSEKYKKKDITQDAFGSQANVNISDKKLENNINFSKNKITKQFNNKNSVNMKSDADFINISSNLSTEDCNSESSPVKFNELSSNRVKHGNYDSKTTEPLVDIKVAKHSKVISKESDDVSNITSAYDFVQDLRKQQNIPQSDVKKGNRLLDVKVDSKGFRILKNQVVDLSFFTQDEIFDLLKQNILYSDDNLMILNKPYSLVMHESVTTKSPCLSGFLDKLANEMDQQKDNPKLFTVHRLDKETTGCLLLARNETMAQHLKSLFAQRKIIKKYWILTSRVPDPPEGVIDIPIAEGRVENKKRMVLHPEIPKDMAYKNHSKRGKHAVTSYTVVSESGNAALVEATPLTGIKHQIRVHFGFGLGCPILGDHKYSHLDKLAPQKLPSDILQRLHVRQSKVRHIPLHIHAKSVTVPGYFEGRDLFVKAPLPNHMKENLRRLKFKK